MRTISEIKYTEDELRAFAKVFAASAKQTIIDITSNRGSRNTAFTSITKDNIMDYLLAPATNAKNLRNASIAMYQNSPQYRRLIQYYAYMPVWAYTLSPVGYDPTKANIDTYQKSYTKVTKQVENMNLKHELSKACVISLVEGVLFGAIWSSTNSFFIQRIDPDMCTLSSIEDGTWMYAVDMSKIKEEDLIKYPPEFTSMWNEYQRSGQKLQEVPSKISFCLKADESTTYPNPPLAGVLPEIYDLYTYKEMSETATALDNYKLICMTTPSNSQGEPTVGLELMKEYYNHIARSLPDYVGLAMSPTELTSISFDKSRAGSTTEEISNATQRFWYASGCSPLLFGDATNTTAQALSYSIKADEEVMIAMMYQCERLVNRHLKTVSGSQKWKINILPVTIFSQEKWIGYTKEAATLGQPVKTAYASLVGCPQTDIAGMAFLENDVLGLPDVLIPLSSSYTQSGEDSADEGDGATAEGGRPQLAEEDLTDEGAESRNKE